MNAGQVAEGVLEEAIHQDNAHSQGTVDAFTISRMRLHDIRRSCVQAELLQPLWQTWFILVAPLRRRCQAALQQQNRKVVAAQYLKSGHEATCIRAARGYLQQLIDALDAPDSSKERRMHVASVVLHDTIPMIKYDRMILSRCAAPCPCWRE